MSQILIGSLWLQSRRQTRCAWRLGGMRGISAIIRVRVCGGYTWVVAVKVGIELPRLVFVLFCFNVVYILNWIYFIIFYILYLSCILNIIYLGGLQWCVVHILCNGEWGTQGGRLIGRIREDPRFLASLGRMDTSSAKMRTQSQNYGNKIFFILPFKKESATQH